KCLELNPGNEFCQYRLGNILRSLTRQDIFMFLEKLPANEEFKFLEQIQNKTTFLGQKFHTNHYEYHRDLADELKNVKTYLTKKNTLDKINNRKETLINDRVNLLKKGLLPFLGTKSSNSFFKYVPPEIVTVITHKILENKIPSELTENVLVKAFK